MIPRKAAQRLSASALGIAASLEVIARPGGGSHSGSSGGNSSGGGGYSTSSSVGSSQTNLTPGDGHPLSFGGFIALLVFFVVFFVVVMRLQRIQRDQEARLKHRPIPGSGPSGAPSIGQSNRPPLPGAVEKIRAQDPGFEIETFLQRAEMSFFLVERGVQRNDPVAVRPYLNDAMFAQVSDRIAKSKAEHRHTLLESLNVRAVHLVDASCDDSGQSLQVHLDLVYRAKSFDDANEVIADEGEDRRRGERWSFVRAAGARTSSVGDVTASRCPACGAELRLSLDGVCTHCKANVTNGTIDWVVAQVRSAPFLGFTSDSQMATTATSVGEGIANLRAADPSFSIEAFRVRVRTAITTLQLAWCKQDLDAGRAFLSPGCYFAWRAQLETMAAEGRRNVMEHFQVRSILPTRIVHGRVFDDLTVRITAASADYDVDKDGRIVFGDRTVREYSEDWTFQRSVGVATSNKPGTLENVCPNCGAPVALTQIGECRYCKAAVTSGKFDWVLSRIEQHDDPQGGDEQADDGSVAA